jgi:hypothetical protein
MMVAYVESGMMRDGAIGAFFFNIFLLQLPNTSALVLKCLHLTVDWRELDRTVQLFKGRKKVD